MLVSLIKSTRINTLTLPNRVIGNYWVTDYDDNNNEQNLISIEAQDGAWRLISNDDIAVVENNAERDYVYLKEYAFYLLKFKQTNTYLLLYCSPVYDKTFKRYYIGSNQEITIGNNNANAIYYDNSGVDNVHAKLAYYSGSFIVTDNNSRLGVYVNKIRVQKQQKLENGDIIFIAGLKIIVLIEDNVPIIIVNNPDGLVRCQSNVLKVQELKTIENPSELLNTVDDPDDVLDVDLYKEDDYFHKKPRFKSNVKTLDIQIDAPPSAEKSEEMPVMLTLGPMVTMGVSSAVMSITAVTNVLAHNSTWGQAMPAIAIGTAMLGSLILWPSLTRRYETKRKQRKEEIRQLKYSQYIEGKRQTIVETIRTQRQILAENNLSLEECQQVILKRKMNLWERKYGDEDFLVVNLGSGVLPMDINIQYPEEHFSLEDDNLREMVMRLGSEPKNLADVPLTISLYEKNILALIGTKKLNKSYIDRLILQLVTFHSYDELKIVVFTSKNNEESWDYIKILPHCWSNDKSIRFFGTTNDEIKEVCYHLDRELSSRRDEEEQVKSNSPYYLIITDSIKTIRSFDVIKDILGLQENYGFGLLIMNDRVSNLPTECKAFINVSEKNSDLFENVLNTNHLNFRIDFDTNINMYECAKVLANMPIEIGDDSEALPNKYGFLEMYNVGKVEQLNSLNRWQKNNPILTLQAQVGVGKGGEKINLDLHEKFHGPHGLVAGSTGSGKSEFIITYILSMAVNYHPYEVQFILIDYKGGGLAGAFENKETGIRLPHLAGTITNLDTSEMNRALASIESELKRRQRIFNEARELSGESTIDIYKYQKLYRNGVVKEPIAHLFIISDEFAELKSQQPEFMQQLISTARIGRSLGVHLILATQKPAGIVDNQIWSNTRFRVCLRVQEKSDSNDVIKCPDAALIKQTGRFYLQVGYNEIFELGQSAWCGGKYYPAEKLKKTVDTSIDFVDNVGFVIKSAEKDKHKDSDKAQGEELNNVVAYLSNIAATEEISVKQLWLDRIPDYITVAALMRKYDIKPSKNYIAPIIGEYDDPSNQSQDILRIPFVNDGNGIVYGVSGSGKENLISSMIFSSMYLYTPEELNYYVLDFGSETLKVFDSCPLVGDVLLANDKDKIANLFKLLSNKVEERKKLFAPYGGSYEYYMENSDNKLPVIVVIINNFEVYDDSYLTYEELLLSLTREGSKYGIYFFLSVNTPNGVRFKMRQNFNQEFVLQQNNENDYTAILGNVKKNYPSKIKGRGIIKKNDTIYEFQTAYPAPKNKESYTFIKEQCETCAKEFDKVAEHVPTLPDHIAFKDVKHELGKSDAMIIGYNKETLDIVKYDFTHKPVTLITAQDISMASHFVRPLIKQFASLNKCDVLVIDAEELQLTMGIGNLKYVDVNFDDNFTKLEKFINDYYQQYLDSDYDRHIFENERPATIFICGLESFRNKLGIENKNKFGQLFEHAKDLGIVNFVIVESADKLKKFETESWYKSAVNNTTGIWVGNGVSEQFILKLTKVTKEIREDIPDNFCYVIARGKPILTQFIESFDILND